MTLTALWLAVVLSVHDGDTFKTTVQLWPGQALTTDVRLLGWDAPELAGKCAKEKTQAIAAKQALVSLLGGEFVFLSAVKPDKFGTRVDATVTNMAGQDVGKELAKRGLVVPYAGTGPRHNWCK